MIVNLFQIFLAMILDKKAPQRIFYVLNTLTELIIYCTIE